MERSLELYADGRLVEYAGDQTVKLIETHGQVDALVEACVKEVLRILEKKKTR